MNEMKEQTNRVIQLLTERDGLSIAEATELIDSVVDEMVLLVNDNRPQEAEDLFCSELGLEPDYMLDVLY
jgi:hypothetical protein